MANGLRIIPQALRSINSTAFTGNYQALGTPLAYSCCLVKIVNNSNILVTISWDSVTDHDILPAGSFTLYDVGSDAGSQRGLYVAANTQFFIKGAAPGANAGLVYLVAFNTSEF